MSNIMHTIFLAIIFVVSISLHEYAHARASDKLGDPTPKMQGRLTPNPLVHIDIVGFLLIFIINFGRGRPVIVNPSYYKNKLRDELLVALAGPITNIFLAIFAILVSLIYVKVVGNGAMLGGSTDPVLLFWSMFSWINIALAVFNMIPIYPLDGYRIVKYLSPKTGAWMEHNRQIIIIILLALIFLPNLLNLPFDPISNIIVSSSQFLYSIIANFLSILVL